jgi:hypothetical protein
VTSLPEPAAVDRSSFVRVADALASAGLVSTSRADQLYARCPAHDDGHASLSVTWRVDDRTGAGRTFVRCHTGCDVSDVVEALGLTLSDLYDTPPARPADPTRPRWTPPARPRRAVQPPSAGKKAGRKARRRVVETYPYADADGRVIYEVTRWEPKEFTVRVVDSVGRRQPRWPVPARRVLYRLPTVLAARAAGVPVWVAEGEKDVDALVVAGAVATCNAGGAAANGAERDRWLPQYTEALAGAHVVLVVDLDEPTPRHPIPAGLQHAAHLVEQLAGHVASLRVVAPHVGEDAADHLAAGLGLDEFEPFDLLAALTAAHRAAGSLDEFDPAALAAALGSDERIPAADTPTTPEPAAAAASSAPGSSSAAAAPLTKPAEHAASGPEPADDDEPVDLQRERQRRRGSDDPPPPLRVVKVRDRYEVLDGELCQLRRKNTRDGDGWDEAKVLLPAAPRLLRRLRYDLGDGAPARVTHYDLAVTANGETVDLPAIPLDDWRSLAWVAELPWPCPFEDTQSGRARVLAGITMVSGPTPVETLYGALGWRQIGDRWVYLHAGGALDGRGPRPDVRVEVASKYADFALPDPIPAGDHTALRAALDASLALMDAIPDRLAAPMLGAAYRACLGYSRVTVLPVGGASSGKTGLAAVGQQHYCPAARYDHLPFGAGEDAATLTSLEEHRHTVGDMLTIVDDGAPDRGTERLGQRLNLLARSQAEQRGKDRGTRTGGIRPEHKPRGLLGVTAEQWTGIESAETRVVALDMSRGELDPRAVFAPLDRDGAPEQRAALIATMVTHHADRMPLTTWLRDTRSTFTDAMIREDSPDPGVEARRSEAVADLAVGWRALLDMAVERGALDPAEAEQWWTRAWAGLLEAKERMMSAAANRRPPELVADALRAAFVRKTAALIDVETGHQPVHPGLCGWEQLAGHLDGGWRRVGAPIGWTDGEQIWLQPTAATDEIIRHTRAAGTPLNLSRDGVTGVLADAGVLRVRQTSKGPRYTQRKRVGPGPGPGHQITGWQVPWSWLFPTDEDDPDTDDVPDVQPTGDPVPPAIEPGPPEPPGGQAENAPEKAAQMAANRPAPPAPAVPAAEPCDAPGAAEPAVDGPPRSGYYSGVALVAAAAMGWLARPGQPPAPVDLADASASLGTLLAAAEGFNLGHRDGRGRYRGARHAYGQLWVLPGLRAKLGLPEAMPQAIGEGAEPPEHRQVRQMLADAGWTLSSRSPQGWMVVYREGGRRLFLVVPEWQLEQSPFGELTEPAQALAARLARYAEMTGIAYRYSPGVTGTALIATTRPQLRETDRPTLPPPAQLPTREGDYRWQRPMAPDERAMRWVDAWDVNGLYLGAATSLPLGHGEAEHVTDAPPFDAKCPGYWRISAFDWTHARLPDPLRVAGRARGEQLWVTTPTMKILTELYGLDVEISEAWIWRPGNCGRVLDKWAAELRDARRALQGRTGADDRAVLDAVKATYAFGIGRLDKSTLRGGNDVLHRPDWRHHVVAQGRYALTRKILAAAEVGAFPLAVAVDAVVYASDTDEPTPPAGWTVGDQLGQIKHIGRAPADEVEDLLADGEVPAPTLYERDETTVRRLGLMDTLKAGER